MLKSYMVRHHALTFKETPTVSELITQLHLISDKNAYLERVVVRGHEVQAINLYGEIVLQLVHREDTCGQG